MIVGVDLSSYRIDLAWVDTGVPQCAHQILGGNKDKLLTRLRNIMLLFPANTKTVIIEKPMSHHRTSLFPLACVVGVIANQSPVTADVYLVRSQRIRGALGVKDTKAEVQAYLLDTYPNLLKGWDEHQLDAMAACLGGRAIMESNHPNKEKYLHGS